MKRPQLLRLHQADNSPFEGLITYRALPTDSIETIDPFLFLNHHGPQFFPPNNSGLPFGPHPHRGMETVTFIIEGDISHRDNGGHESIIDAGGVQWMTAGSGLIHAEVSSSKFMQNGGPLEILQLWINLPARSKMSTPAYQGLQKASIPKLMLQNGKVELQLIFGEYKNTAAAFISDIGLHLFMIHLKAMGNISFPIPEGDNIFFYVVKGNVSVDGTQIKMLHLAEFDQQRGELMIESETDSIVILGHAKPLNEPVVFRGPFVMNTDKEIVQAYNDYRAGKFGIWEY